MIHCVTLGDRIYHDQIDNLVPIAQNDDLTCLQQLGRQSGHIADAFTSSKRYHTVGFETAECIAIEELTRRSRAGA